MRRKNREYVPAPILMEVPQTAPSAEVLPTAQPPIGAFVASDNFHVVSNMMPMGLPQYQSVDGYGRLFRPVVTYGPMPHSNPVPVPIPSSVVQVAPIVTPITLVPYSSQTQPLYQYDTEY